MPIYVIYEGVIVNTYSFFPSSNGTFFIPIDATLTLGNNNQYTVNYTSYKRPYGFYREDTELNYSYSTLKVLKAEYGILLHLFFYKLINSIFCQKSGTLNSRDEQHKNKVLNEIIESYTLSETLRHSADRYKVLTFSQLDLLRVCIANPENGDNLINKAAMLMNFDFLAYLIECRHNTQFQHERFTNLMRNACTIMLDNSSFTLTEKALNIYKFYQALGHHFSGFRYDLKQYFLNQIAIKCQSDPELKSHIAIYIRIPNAATPRAYGSTTITTNPAPSAPILFSSSYHCQSGDATDSIPVAEIAYSAPAKHDTTGSYCVIC